MGKKGKRNGGREVVLKTKIERLGEILDIFDKFKGVGLGPKYKGVDEFYSLCKDYVNDGIGRNGKINITGEKRVIVYVLPTRKNTICSINLKYDKNV
tara:strand:+ start:162 stop:452 length:291 start_codon:yes stop_codon:yes gene_type:complete